MRALNNQGANFEKSLYSSVSIKRIGIEVGEYPKTIPFGESKSYTFSVKTPRTGYFEWQAPEGWIINGEGNIYKANDKHSVQITTGKCYTNEKVKVRVTNNQTTPWFEFPNTIEIPAINYSSEFIQYYAYPFSLTMSNDNIASVQWLLNENVVATVTGKSEAQLLLLPSGKVKVSARVLIQGCPTPVTIPNIEIDVISNPLTIAGNAAICDKGTYFMNNLPPGAILQWSADDNRLLLVSEQGTSRADFQKTGNGNFSTFIRAEISLQGGGSVTVTKDIYAGVPQNVRMLPEGNYYDGYQQGTNQPVLNPYKFIFAEGDVGVDPSFHDPIMLPYSDASNWEIVKLTDNFDYEIYASGNPLPPAGLTSLNDLVDDTFNPNYHPKRVIILKIKEKMAVVQPVTFISFKVRVKNTCGWSDFKVFELRSVLFKPSFP